MKRAWNLLRDVLDRATIYLPIILTAAVALGTYWLVRNAPKLLAPTAKAAPTHEPDYFMRGFVIKNFLPSGDLRSELAGKEGRHYPDNDTLEVDQVRMRSVSPAGLVTHAMGGHQECRARSIMRSHPGMNRMPVSATTSTPDR